MKPGIYSDEHGFTKRLIDKHFPRMSRDSVDWVNASKPSDSYNCMGFAVGVLKWWQPAKLPDLVENQGDYWPPGVTHSTTIEAFVEAAKTEGFICCENADWSAGLEKIALFYVDQGTVTEFKHVALQVSPDNWKSKFADLSDIEHTLDDLKDGGYGNHIQFMSRARK